jgi:type I restriction enzyme R subunit
MNMSHKITEDELEHAVIDILEGELHYKYIYGKDLSPQFAPDERSKMADVILSKTFRESLEKINPTLPDYAIDEAFKKVTNILAEDLVSANEVFHNYAVEGVKVTIQTDEEERGDIVKIIDFENIHDNDFIVCNQFTVIEEGNEKRPDIIIFVNGLPLVVIELKNPIDENATVDKAYNQLQTYKSKISSLFKYNAILVASDGLDAAAGSLSADRSRFLPWKSFNGKRYNENRPPQIEILTKGLLNKGTILNMMRFFTVFESVSTTDPQTGIVSNIKIKKIAAYHQFDAVNSAYLSTAKASGPKGNRKGGVVWHTQGSGKSLSMLFFAGIAVQTMDNPTIVVLTDRNDLDDQLFGTFSGAENLLRQKPVQADDRNQLIKYLSVNAGGVIFTTIQKFAPANGESIYPLLTDRRNVIVIADEAHRSQYGFSAKFVEKKDKDGNIVGVDKKYGFAKYLRDALPNATFLGFTGTPVSKTDANTLQVFGGGDKYVDIYDIEQAVIDKATVRIYYESRLVKLNINEEEYAEIDKAIADIESHSSDEQVNVAKAKWARLEAIAGAPDRIDKVARDFIAHFEKRNAAFDGKAMIVCMSRRNAAALYEALIKHKPEWHNEDRSKGGLKVIMTSASSDEADLQKHHTSKSQRKDLANRFKDSNDPLKVVIVRDMWLTGFDVPCLTTLYVDKPMMGHNLMQAIARVNRVYKDKPGGFVVDYIGIASELKDALLTYTESGGKGNPTFDTESAVALMQNKYEVVRDMFHNFNYQAFFTGDLMKRMPVILDAQDHILSLEDGKNRYLKETTAISRTYALVAQTEAAEQIRDDVAFFQAVKARIAKVTGGDGSYTSDQVDHAVRQIVSKAVHAGDVVDIFDAAGLKKPEISILSDDFLEEIRDMQRKNLAVEALRRLLNDEIKGRSRGHQIESRAFSEMLQSSIKKYQNKLLTTAELIEEMIALAKKMREARKRGEELGLSDEEYAFYTALEMNESAKEVMSQEVLRTIAKALLNIIHKNATIDWNMKENVRAKLRIEIKKLLKEYGYPPDLEKMAIDRVLEQSEYVTREMLRD